MIDKERLEELIEQGATIWTDEYRGSHFKIKLTKHFVAKLGDSFDLYGYGCDYFGIPLNHLYETKEEAEWYREFGCIERTERLELPTWEEFIKNYQTLGDVTILDERCVMFTDKTKTYSLYADDNSIWVGCDSTGTSFFCEDLNKENYIKACRFCKRLFLGEKK